MKDGMNADKERPLSGAVICFTSVSLDQRTQLVSFAKEMGAIERPDLTSEVTHLLVGATDSPKYKFVARERNDVVVLRPEWIEAVRQFWMLDEDTDIQALEAKYKLPSLFGLTICITGFSDMGFRTKMHDTTVENGADFRKDLTKSVTHLIARNGEGEKYKFATQWNIKVVTIKWFNDSLERGMILDEERYHPHIPPEEQGVGAWNREILAKKGHWARDKNGTKENPNDQRPRKKLRRSASTKLIGQNENIWGDIIGAGFANNEATEPENEDSDNRDSDFSLSKPILQAAKSFASESTFNESIEKNQLPKLPPPVPEGFLGGAYFYLHGFSSKQMGILRRHVESNGAQCVETMMEFSRPSIPKTGQGLYIMVPYQTPKSKVPSTEDMAFECEFVTDMWLERCLYARALVSPESHVASTPFPKFPIPGFPGMRICSTGFGGIDLLHVSKLVNLMGATYNEVLTPSASVLLCLNPKSASQDKLRHTAEWKVPAVSADWLWTSIQTGQKKPFEPYLVEKRTTQPKSRPEQLGAAFLPDKEPQKQPEILQDSRSKSSIQRAPKRTLSGNHEKNRVTAIDDGFARNELDIAPQASIPESRSPSPEVLEKETEPTTEKSEPEPPNPPEPSALATAMQGFIQQAQAAKSKKQQDPTPSTEDPSFPARRKRKPLLGRASSHSSSKVLESMIAPSRASSIDTLNDDGLGTTLESANPTRDNSVSRATSHANEQSLASMFSGEKFDFLADQLTRNTQNEDEENQEPPMTQLDYEDADAAAMRAEFLRDAGKLPEGSRHADSSMLLGEVEELEDIGWGSKRRTRRQPVKSD
ncbi:hypothetical protein N7495_005958 [Penicillium taxi]|uniref:uncharacterized protein n=1 Tax=Penicillium taxi TaxID=168475 RepID=UPI002545AE1E|nr:uncharacterized protein N7495_005958 [Penicillium taxi]KAJ5894267.1 hypothetical protein N7495_005958 [Penicillium taxi]